MYKKLCSILMLYLALAIMLGHNFIEHKHHDDQDTHHHHHAEEAHHHDTNTNDESENDDKNLGYFFSFIQHGSYEPTYINSPTSLAHYSIQIPDFTAHDNSAFISRQVKLKVWQNAPPFKEKLFNSVRLSLDGLRAPPAFSA